MDNKLRKAWTKLVRPEDYDAHMAAIGQAQANAALLAKLFECDPPRPGSELLVAGAGTGQLFDYLSPALLKPYRTTFTDINAEYLNRLAARVSGVPGIEFKMIVDDIEASRLPGSFELVVAILVLEHVDWRKAIAEMSRLSAARVFIVLQENPPHITTAVTKGRPITGSMRVFTEVHPHLIPQSDVVAGFTRHEFELRRSSAREVLDSKRMVALEFEKRR
jgi:ubiquinone/menaquinone biosynthesis C-methylase UbiE